MPYINIPLPLAFFGKNIETNPLFVSFVPIKFLPYEENLIKKILEDSQTRRDINRVQLKFGEKDKGQTYGTADEPILAIFNKVILAAASFGLMLSVNDVKAIYAFSCSIGGEVQQGGLFRMLDTLYKLMLTYIDVFMVESPQSINMRLHVERLSDNQLKLTYEVEANKFVNYNSPKKGLFNGNPKTLLKKNCHFLLTSLQERGRLYFNLVALEREDDLNIDADLFETLIVPAALKKINKLTTFTAESLVMVPLLIDSRIREAFCEKIAKQPLAIKKQVLGYIEACFSHDLKNRNAIMAMDEIQQIALLPPVITKRTIGTQTDTSKETPKISPQVAVTPVSEVKEIVAPVVTKGIREMLTLTYDHAYQKLIRLGDDEEVYGKIVCDAAKDVLLAMDNLHPLQRSKNIVLLTEVLERTHTAITQPANTDNLQAYRELMVPIRNKNWLKLAGGMGLVLAGAALAAISVAVAVASFGATTFLSSLGIAISVSIVMQAVSVTCTALGLTMIPGGVLLARDRQLTGLLNVTGTFWQPQKKLTVPHVGNLEVNHQPGRN